MGDYVRFPLPEEHYVIKHKLSTFAGFPNIIGLIDGTHISLKSPGGAREISFVNRKGGHSVNAQVVCDGEMLFRDVVIKWPGSTHDSFIWRNSNLRQHFVDQPPNGYLLGELF